MLGSLSKLAARCLETDPFRSLRCSLATATRPSMVAAEATDKAHHSSDGRFTNPWIQQNKMDKGLREIIAWQWSKKVPSSGWLAGNLRPTLQDWTAAFPVAAPDWDALNNPPADRIQATWVGHASVLVQMGGLCFLTDPVFAQRCSPFSFMGPKYVSQVPFRLDDERLPRIDFVVISHNHYDHLCLPSVRQLHKRFGDALSWYVPLGIAAWFKSSGVQSVKELDWWGESSLSSPAGSATITFLPAQHWSNRSGLDRRKTLWGSWAIHSHAKPGLRFWFAGDTGYSPVHAEIGRRMPPPDLSAIPIGAYDPRFIMTDQHCDPEEALQIHKDVKSKQSLAIHCCTFCLTDEAMDEPPQRLAAATAAQSMPAQEFVAIQHGTCITSGTADGSDCRLLPIKAIS